MKTYKPFERYTEVRGNVTEHKWHSDFQMHSQDSVVLYTEFVGGVIEHIVESPPQGKGYKVCVRIGLEEIDDPIISDFSTYKP